MSEDALDVALTLGAALDDVGVDYFLGGSLASSLQGEPRATNDIDVVVQLAVIKVGPLAQRLGANFSVDVEALTDAVKRRASWNVFYLPLFTKIDIFICGNAPYDLSEFSRRRRLFPTGDGRSLWIKSPEDTVLRKLWWFEVGGRVSSRQLRDVVQVLRVAGTALDTEYLQQWAAELNVLQLLQDAQREAATNLPPP